MNKKNSIKKFIFLGLCCVIGMVLIFAQFNLPFANASIFKGFIRDLNVDTDISGGVNIVLTVKENYGSNLSEDLKTTIERVEAALSYNGYDNCYVSKLAKDKISITASDVDEIDEFAKLFTKPQTISVKLNDDDTIYLNNTHLESVTPAGGYTDSTTYNYGLNIKFNEEGKTILANITTDTSKTLSFYLGEDVIFSSSISEQLTDGSLFVYSSNYNYNDVKMLSNKILSGAFRVNFELSNVHTFESVKVTDWVVFAIICCATLVLIYIILGIFYKDFALITLPVTIINFILTILLCWSIPFVKINLIGIAMLIISIIFAIYENVLVFNAVKKHYSNGKRIHMAIRNSLDETWKPILLVSGLQLTMAAILMLLGTKALFAAGSVLFVTSFVNAFTSIVLTRFVMKWYMPFNSNNAKRLNLTKEEK